MRCTFVKMIFFGGLALLACLPLGSVSNAEAIQWVTVGDPGNTPETKTGFYAGDYGAVATSYRIMKFEFTNQQYADFLNSVDASGTNPYSLFDPNMANDRAGGIIFEAIASDGSKYAVKTDKGDKPVNYVSWFDAARVSNWYQNGATSSSSTETGAYTLVSGQISGTVPTVNDGAKYYIPTEDQWYKAAYYKGGSTNAGYWPYATQSNSTPVGVTADSFSNGSAGNTGNYANYDDFVGKPTTVGTNGGPSAYGAFDMTGNVYEWNDFKNANGSYPLVRGGAYAQGYQSQNSGYRYFYPPSDTGPDIGFRLASSLSTSVPEIDPSCFGSALALVIGSLGLLERRRVR